MLFRYPKLNELVQLKNKKVAERATPPYYVNCDLKTFDLGSLGTKFDVILVRSESTLCGLFNEFGMKLQVDPPWEEYRRRCPGAFTQNETR